MNATLLKYYTLFLTCALVLLGTIGVQAQGVTPTKGKDFWLGFMKNYEVQPTEALNLFIVSDQATTGVVEVPGQSWSQSFTVAPNVTTTVNIPNNIAEVLSAQVIEDRGIHVTTADTVAVFAINFDAFTADGTKILPTPTLGIDYIAASYVGLQGYESELLVVATEDGTEVEITPSTATSAGNAAGVPFIVSLNAGQCYQVRATSNGDLTGTRITGTPASGECRPFAVFSGTDCTNIPTGCVACDHICEENFPINLWGTEYYVTPWIFEVSSAWPVDAPNYTYRVIASENGTTFSVDGGAPFNLNAGEYEEFQFEEVAHCVQANFPVAVVQYMEGISCGGNGDPAMLVLDDVEKKIDNITFSTVESTVITAHYLNIVINASDIGNVTLDGVVIDPTLFQPFTNCPSQVWAGMEISAGSHTLDAPGGGVTGYVYGNGEAESYAYSVGSFSPTPPITINDAFCTSDGVTLVISNTYFNPYWYNYNNPEEILYEGYAYELPLPIQNGLYVGVGSELLSGCEELFYYSVEVPTPPAMSVSPDQAICQYESVQLTAQGYPESGFYLYSWSPSTYLSNPNIANPVATPMESITYTVTVSTLSGCAMNQDDVQITVTNGEITQYSTPDDEVLFCNGDNEQIGIITEKRIWSDDFEPGVSWGVWETITNGTANSTCGSVTGNGLYFNGNSPREAITTGLDVTNGGTIYFSLKVANGAAPCDNAEPGDNIVLAYSNNNGPWVDIATYYEAAYPNFVAVSAPIPAGAIGTNTRFRWRQVGAYVNNQDNWVLDNMYVGEINTNDYTYSWTPTDGLNNPNISNPLAAPLSSTMYYVEMIDPQTGCNYEDSVYVNVGQHFDLDIISDTTLCDVQGIQLYANPDVDADYTFEWTPATTLSSGFSQTPLASPTSTTTYNVNVVNEQGCENSGSVTITVGQLLDLTVSANPTLICAGQTTNLSAVVQGGNNNLSYSWTPAISIANPNNASTPATPNVNTTFICTVIDDNSGCALSDDVAVSVYPAFEVFATPDDTSMCVMNGLPVSAVSTYNGALTWSWSPSNLVANANVPATTMTATATDELIVTATNQAGCSAQDTVFVTQIIEVTDLGPDTGVCEDNFVTLSTGWPDSYTFDWSNGESTSSIVVNQSGTYEVTVTSPDGCVSQDQVVVDVYTYPVIVLGNDTAFCAPQTITLQAPVDPIYNYLWSTGANTSSIIVSTSGIYTVSVDNGYCFSDDQISIAVNPLPYQPFTDETTFCYGFPPYTLELNALNPGAQFLWNTGYNGSILETEGPGYYSVYITTPFGCAQSFGISISEICPGSLFAPNSFTPNGDGLNDEWFVKGENIIEFDLKLYNRWGELFWETKNPEDRWLGQRRSDGEYYIEPGVYPFIIQYKLVDENGVVSDDLVYKGQVTLVR